MPVPTLTLIKEIPGKGRGLCARKVVPAGTLLDSSPVLVLPDEERQLVERTRLKHYYFYWDEESDTVWRAAVALGRISLCNHSPQPNARFVLRKEELLIDLYSLTNIAPNEEITINYDCELWFEIKA